MPRCVLFAVFAALVFPAPASAGTTRTCPQEDPPNAIVDVRVQNLTCPAGFKVAKRTNSVKCFLNGDSCEHRYRGRTWRCSIRDGGARVRCSSGGRRLVRWRT